MYKYIIKRILFFLDPEKAHFYTLFSLNLLLKIPFAKYWLRNRSVVEDQSLKKVVWGIEFPNPVGLAAGFDKDGKYFELMSHLGFGFIEIGTVTPIPQEGNEKPRLFRLPQDQALINRMGFNNDGMVAMKERLKGRKDKKIIIGGNIGKNKNTPNEDAINDYILCFDTLYPYVDYFVVNVSSPNTPGLRELQEKKPLTELLTALKKKNQNTGSPRPILLKIAPDLSDEQLDDIIDIVISTRIDGIIATNTTTNRSSLTVDTSSIGNGGLSGEPLKERSNEVIRYIHKRSEGKIIIIGVGGIMTKEDAKEKLDAGATLIQIYTGLIYGGPFLVADINRHLLSSAKQI